LLKLGVASRAEETGVIRSISAHSCKAVKDCAALGKWRATFLAATPLLEAFLYFQFDAS
jgi:hypothetical protein